ncbi:hypothetical protein GCG54_00011019, partial [Colletotrichum gloeosporioides]
SSHITTRFFAIVSLAAVLSVASNTFTSPTATPKSHVVEKTANVDKRADSWYGPARKNTLGFPIIWLEYCFMRSGTTEARLRDRGCWGDWSIMKAAKCRQNARSMHGTTEFRV